MLVNGCLCGTVWCLLMGADLEVVGCFVPVCPRSPCVEGVRVFLSPAQHLY